MTDRIVILARHGETELNRLGIVQGSGVDPGLNQEGKEQAAALASAIGNDFDLYVSSGMQRAKETLDPFATDGRPVQTMEGFREICWGIYEGKVPTPESRAAYGELMSHWQAGRLDEAFAGGESAQQLHDRLLSAWNQLIEQKFDRALVILHGRALRCLACLIDGQPLTQMDEYPHANTGYYEVHGNNTGWRIVRTNEHGHLKSLHQPKAKS